MSVTLKDLKFAYNYAVKKGDNAFELNGCMFDTGYAKYLIQYFATYKVEDSRVIDFQQEEA